MTDRRIGWNGGLYEHRGAGGDPEHLRPTSRRRRHRPGPHHPFDGYNGSLPGTPHCDDAGHDIENGHCVRTVHAEANAVAQAAKNGVRLEGSELYVTSSPCLACFKLVANSGIKTVYYKEFYRDERITEYARLADISLTYMGPKT